MADVAEVEKLATKKTCPVCGKSFGRGFTGHLRFVHGVSSDDAKDSLKKAEPDYSDSMERFLELADELKACRDKMRELDSMDRSGFFSEDKVAKVIRKGLEKLEAKLLEEAEALLPKSERQKSDLERFFFGDDE